MKKLASMMEKIFRGFAAVSSLSLFVIMVFIVLDVSLRYLFNKPIKGSYELVSLAMLFTVFLGFAYAQARKSLIHVTIILKMLPGRLKYVVWSLGNVLSTVIAVMLAQASFQQAGKSLLSGTNTGVLYIPIYPFYYVVFVGFALLAVMLLIDTVRSLLAVVNEEYAAKIRSGWGA